MTKIILDFDNEADIISVMLGVNDFTGSLPLGNEDSKDNTTIYGSLYLICEQFKANYSNSFIFFMTPLPYRNGNNQNSQGYVLADVAEAVKVMVGKYNYLVLGMYNVSKYEEEMNLSNSDGLHPSQEYFTNIGAPIIVDFIKENYLYS